MNQSDVLYLAKEALMTALMIGGPVLGVSLLVGLLVSIFSGHDPDSRADPDLYSQNPGHCTCYAFIGSVDA
nr:flagellar biosynthetic protein FliQ [Desulfitobacterium hafniense]